MLKIALALIATVVTGSVASATPADSHGIHLAYSCQDQAGHRLTLSITEAGAITLIQEGRSLTLTQVDGTDDTFDGTIPCTPAPEGFARCGAIQFFELQLSSELVKKEISGQASYGGSEYSCRMNMM